MHLLYRSNNFWKAPWKSCCVSVPQPLSSPQLSHCCILTFDPAKHAIPKTRKLHIPLAQAGLSDNMGQGKIPWYSHRLMHRKRVTCELHDSYFRSMTIKHAIPRTAEVTHPDGQLWRDIEWAVELLYNSVRTGSHEVGVQMSWRQDVVGKATTQQKGPSGPPIEFWRPVGDKMR